MVEIVIGLTATQKIKAPIVCIVLGVLSTRMYRILPSLIGSRMGE